VIDILIVAVLIYQFLMIVRGRRAAHILTGLLILGLVYAASAILGLQLLSNFAHSLRALRSLRAHRFVFSV